MSDLASSFTILWASQTGNAEWIAKNIYSEAKQRGYTGECFDMLDFEKAKLDTAQVIIFVTSNTGDGDPPDNASKFWRFLRRQKQPDYFAHARFTVLGLGDTNYSNFNNTARRLEKRVKELGGTVFYEKGLADDAEGLENVVDPWIAKLWDVLPTVLRKLDNVEAVTEKVATLEIKPSNAEPPLDEYSINGRSRALPTAAKQYLNLPNSVVKESESPKSEPPFDEFSIKGRSKALPEAVKQYLNLPNSVVKKASGHVIKLELGELTPGMMLNGLPRVPAAVAKLVPISTPEEVQPPSSEAVITPTPVFLADVTRVRCLTTADAVKRTLHLELAVDEGLEFQPGDAFGVIAPNDETLVEAIITRLASFKEGYMTLYNVEGKDLPTHLQKANSLSLANLLRYSVDLTSPPRKALLRMLAEYTSDPNEKATLMYLSSKQGIAQFNAFREQVPNLLDILTTFPSCKPPIDRLLDVLPGHLPRYYSIANSPLKHPHAIHFAFNVVDYINVYNVPRKGVATPWLDHLTGLIPAHTGTPASVDLPAGVIQIPIFLKPNTNAFTLPVETERPLVLIGPGTGIAPFIGFLEHRQAQRRIRKSMGGLGVNPTRDLAQAFGDIWVYYGFRERSKDFLFQQELEAFTQDGTLKKLSLAVSRENEKKTYVQDLLRQDSAALYDMIVRRNAAVYVCGDAKGMAKGVNDALVDMLCTHESLDPVAANKLLMQWTRERKYLRDLWA